MEKEYNNIDPQTFQQRIQEDKSAVIIDVRTGDEYKSGRIPNAKHINIMGGSFAEQVNKLDKEKTYYVYCRSGARSASACGAMAKMGFKNLNNLSGGIMSYRGKIV